MKQWTGIPFVDGGRARAGCDCYGLVRLYFLEELQLELPAYGETPAEDVARSTAAIDAALEDGAWRTIGRLEAQRGDVGLMWGFERVKGRPVKTRRHVGVMVDGRHMLHVEESTDSVIVPLSDSSVRHRLESFWRYRNL